jgi:Brp/Blh family beta-carotene 15,15'-monooxygenase
MAMVAGVPLDGAAATSVACLMLLVFGLPHGTLDLELIKTQSRGPRTGLAALLIVYLGCAALMLALWLVAPVIALGAFILIATVHFSEDWEGTGSRFLALGLALAVLAAPTLFHGAALDRIFVALTGQSEATAIADMMLLVTPLALVVAAVAVAALWTGGRRTQAVAATLAVASMIALPPIIGFVLYFCLFHSPRHLADSLRNVALSRGRAWVRVVLPLTLAAVAIAGAIYGLELRADVASGLIAASFMTLSILTVPHMLAPMIIAWIAAHHRTPEGLARPEDAPA